MKGLIRAEVHKTDHSPFFSCLKHNARFFQQVFLNYGSVDEQTIEENNVELSFS